MTSGTRHNIASKYPRTFLSSDWLDGWDEHLTIYMH